MNSPVFALVGQGRWGKKIQKILIDLGYSVVVIPLSRKEPFETKHQYALRAEALLARVDFDILWLSIPPQGQFTLLCEGMRSCRHIIIEKPLLLNKEQISEIRTMAFERSVTVGVHYQYCFLDAIYELKNLIKSEVSKFEFSGVFRVANSNRLGISPEFNLGIHLVAIKMLHFPNAKLGKIESAYDSTNRRYFSLACDKKKYSLDFTENREPLVQRFVAEYIKCFSSSENFQLDIDFSANVVDAVFDN